MSHLRKEEFQNSTCLHCYHTENSLGKKKCHHVSPILDASTSVLLFRSTVLLGNKYYVLTFFSLKKEFFPEPYVLTWLLSNPKLGTWPTEPLSLNPINTEALPSNKYYIVKPVPKIFSSESRGTNSSVSNNQAKWNDATKW